MKRRNSLVNIYVIKKKIEIIHTLSEYLRNNSFQNFCLSFMTVGDILKVE